MKFSYEWLQSFFDKKLPSPKVLGELLTRRIFETEIVSKNVLEVDVLPSRAAECLSYQGLAREIGAIIQKKPKDLLLTLKTKGSAQRTSDVLGMEMKDSLNCRRYSLRLVEDVKIQKSPSFIQKRLKESGLRPINNIVDLANYVMLETGQPLHVFDLDKIEGRKLIVRRAKPGEKITALDDKTYHLDKDILVIADTQGPLAIAGAKGGKRAEIDSSTKKIIVEAANFSGLALRKVWRNLGLRTDASWRFENGLDLNLTEVGQKRFAFLVDNLYQARPALDVIDFYPQKSKRKEINLSLKNIEKLLGVKVKKVAVLSLLQRLGFQVLQKSSQPWKVVIPSWRLDISREEDLIEEVARLFGYENIPAKFSVVNLIPPIRNESQFWGREVKNIFSRLGFNEAYDYSFLSESERVFFEYPESLLVEIENPVSAHQRYLRPNLLFNLLLALRENMKHRQNIKLFEIGNVFLNLRNHYSERTNLAGVITAQNGKEGFYQLKGVVEHLASSLIIDDVWFDNYKEPAKNFSVSTWHPNRTAVIKVGEKTIGWFGEIHPKIEEDLKVSKALLGFEINFQDLVSLASEDQEYSPISSYPAAKRDLSVIVPRNIKVGEVIAEINEAGGLLVRDVDLAGEYQGTSVPERKKSLTLRIYLQSTDHSLTNREINDLQKKIILGLKNKNWLVRI